jgi:glutamyl-tRNA(Gln) amidotransferase subunit D
MNHTSNNSSESQKIHSQIPNHIASVLATLKPGTQIQINTTKKENTQTHTTINSDDNSIKNIDNKKSDNITDSQKNLQYTGTILPRSELFDANILILKLENGYNVGIDKSRITHIDILKLPQEKEPTISKNHKNANQTQNNNLPTVAFLSFGGTISSRLDYRTGGVVADYGAEDFYKMCPELKSIANIQAKTIAKIMSEDMTPEHWELIVDSIKPYLEDDKISGIVITQGTDTLHFSTSAVSFALTDSQVLTKPVIFTASQRSIDRGSTDAFENIICAISAAAKLNEPIVATCMHETSNDGTCLIIRGTKVRKMHTSRRDSFRPINARAFCRISVDGTIEYIEKKSSDKNKENSLKDKHNNKTHTQHFKQHQPLFQTCGLLYVYPGIQIEQIKPFFDQKYKGLIIAATALGHIPEYIMQIIGELNQIKPVCITTQTIYGRVHPFVYARLREQNIQLSLTFLDDMLPETAYAKLAYATAQKKSRVEIIEFMKENIAHEYSGEIDAECFLN